MLGVGRQRKAVTLNDGDLGARMQTPTEGSRETLPDMTRSCCGHGELPLTGLKLMMKKVVKLSVFFMLKKSDVVFLLMLSD